MSDWRIAYYRLFFWLPAVAATAVFFIAMFTWAKPLADDEPKRIGRRYRELAGEFMEHPERATFVGRRQRGSGWRQAGRIGGLAYGHVRDGEKETVWFEREDGVCLATAVEPLEPSPIMRRYGLYGGVGVLLVCAMSFAADGLYRRFQQERDDLLAVIAHDLSTPLAAIRLAAGRDTASVLALCDRLTRLVANVKSLLGLPGGRAGVAAAPFDLLKAYEEAYELFRFEYRDAFEGEDVAVECGIDATVTGDATTAVHILWNLLGNDLKYAAPYGRVTARFRTSDDKVHFELIDEGPGMSAGEMRRVFRRYYRGSSARRTGEGGFGIGLYISREMARMMGGDITLRTASGGRGCVFTFSMPAASGHVGKKG